MEASKSDHSETILIVDDNKIAARAFQYKISSLGFTTEIENDPNEALAKIQNSKYSLILLDISMPGLSGLDILEQIRPKINSKELPIIMLTAEYNANTLKQATNLGANDVLSKD